MSGKCKNISKDDFILLIVVALFVLLAVGYFLSYQYQAFPDGMAHMGYVNDVVNKGFPDYRYGIYTLGDKYNHLNHPALYYLLAGFSIRLLGLQEYSVITAQVLNIIIGVITVFISFKTLKAVSSTRSSVLVGISVFFLLPMYPLLSASVSNDPLSFLGCAIFLYALVKMKDQENPYGIMICLAIGGAIAALSKATAALAIVCMFIFHFMFFMSGWFALIKKTPLKGYAISILCLAVVAGYYIAIHYQYGSFFPSPQKGPDEMFLVMNPNAQRLSLSDNFALFINGNFFTLDRPYGHAAFEDSHLRIDMLRWLIFAVALFVPILIIFSGIKTYGQKISFAVIIAFIVFGIIYFIVLRKMHLHTGYQGATQARYFFGFLPGFALCMSVAFDLIQNKILRGITLLTVTIMVIASFYPAWGRMYLFPGVRYNFYVEQNSASINYGGLVKGRKFQQSFTALSSRLLKVELMIGTYTRINHSTLLVTLLGADGRVLTEQKVDASTIADNTWVSVTLPPAVLKHGEHYLLQLSSPDADENNFVTWWAIKSDTTEFPAYAGTKYGPLILDSYSGGDAIVDDILQKDSDFTFKLYFGD